MTRCLMPGGRTTPHRPFLPLVAVPRVTKNRLRESRRLQSNSNSIVRSFSNIGGDGDGDSGAGRREWGEGDVGGNKATAPAAAVTVAGWEEEEEANRTIKILMGTAEFLKFSRLLLLLSEAVSVSTSVAAAPRAGTAGEASATSKSRGSSDNVTAGGSGSGSLVAKTPPPPQPSQQQQLQEQLLHRMSLS